MGANTTFQNIVDDVIQPDKPPLLIEDRNDELVAVSSGKADVAMFDLPAAEAIAHADPHFAVAAQLAETEPIAAALPKGSSNVDAVSSALRRCRPTGRSTTSPGSGSGSRSRTRPTTCRCCGPAIMSS